MCQFTRVSLNFIPLESHLNFAKADMVLAVAVTLLVFIALDPITGFSKRRSTKMSSPIHAKHYLPTMVVAPLVYGVLKLLGVLH